METTNSFDLSTVNDANLDASRARNPANSDSDGAPQSYSPHSKRQRLSTACNQCRKRKVRCDEEQPRCRNCALRGDTCVTTDPKVPSREVTRRRARNIPRSLDENLQNRASPSHHSSFVSTPGPPSNANRLVDFGLSSPKSSVATSLGVESESIGETETEVQHLAKQMQPISSDYSYDREMILNTNHNSQKRKLLGNGTLQALARYLDRYFEREGLEPINSRFAFGMQHAEEGPLNGIFMEHSIPPIPDLQNLDDFLCIFDQKIHPMYPVLDLDSFKALVHKLALQDLHRLSPGDIPILSSLYSILSLVSDEISGIYTNEGYSYLCAAFALSAHVSAFPYFSSVQAMLLLTIALRARNKDGAAWQTLGQAIRIAQSIGLHRRVDSGIVYTPETRVRDDDGEEIGSRVWWICYCLEKTMGLEVGRPISIRDVDCNQVKPPTEAGHNYIIHWIGLAQIQSRLIEILYRRRPEKRNASDLLGDIGRIDQELCDWAAAVEPEEIRPTFDLLCADEALHLATFLAMHYYQTVITVHQAALMVDVKTYQSKIAQYCQDSPWRTRLCSSESILLNAARKIANLQIDLIDRKINSKLITATQVMLAMVVLSLNVTKGPKSKRNRLDVELLTAISFHAENEYTAAGQNQDFIEAIRILRSHAQHAKAATAPSSSAYLLATPTSHQASTGQENRHSSISIGDLVNGTSTSAESSLNFFEDFPLDYPWNWLLTDDTDTTPAECSLWNV